MKRLIHLMLAIALVVCSAGSALAAETVPLSESAPYSTEEKTEFPSETTSLETGDTEASASETSETETPPSEEGTADDTTEPPASSQPAVEATAPQYEETETVPTTAETTVETASEPVTEETTTEATTEATVMETTEMSTTSEQTETETTVPPTTKPAWPFLGEGSSWLWLCAGLAVLGIALLVLGGSRKKHGKHHGVPLRLEVIAGDIRVKNALLYLEDTLWIGNSRQCDIQLKGKKIPPQAARIYTQDCFLYVEALSEDVRVCVGGMRIYSPNLLRSGDEITIGNCKFCLLF